MKRIPAARAAHLTTGKARGSSWTLRSLSGLGTCSFNLYQILGLEGSERMPRADMSKEGGDPGRAAQERPGLGLFPLPRAQVTTQPCEVRVHEHAQLTQTWTDEKGCQRLLSSVSSQCHDTHQAASPRQAEYEIQARRPQAWLASVVDASGFPSGSHSP